MAAIGSVIDGKYEILKLVGKGGMSKVYLAMDKRLNKQWAVKEIQKNARDKNNLVVVQSAIAEANMIKKLDHPTLPRIVDIIDNGNVIYIVMDYIEGESLSKVLEREGAQPQEQVIEWAKELCEVLQYLHTRKPPIIYRDMKPANIMLKPDGSLKLIDFGIAREYKDQNIEDTVSLGTKGYAAPEQFGGKGQTDARTDIYCLGVTLYHLVTGQNPCEPPYELYPIRHWNPSLSAGLEAIIQKCTQLNPVDRYQSCAELMYALDHYEEADESYKNLQKSKLKKFVISASATLACVLIGCGFLIANSADQNKKYNNYVATGQTAADFYDDAHEDFDNESDMNTATGRVNKYAAAIAIKKDRLDNEDGNNPYFKIVDECINECKKSENSGSSENMEDLNKAMSVVTENLLDDDELKKDENYGKLSYEIARYYLFYYPKPVAMDRIRLANVWLNSAAADSNPDSKSKNTAKMLKSITDFYEIAIDEHSKSSDFDKELANFETTIQNAENNSTGEISRPDVYELALFVLKETPVINNLKNHGSTAGDIIALAQFSGVDQLGEDDQKAIAEQQQILKTNVETAYNGGVD